MTSPDTTEPTQQEAPKTGLSALYETRETESGAFEVILPGFTDLRGNIMGTCTETYFTAEDAAQAAWQAKIDQRQMSEIWSGEGTLAEKKKLGKELYDRKALAKTYTNDFWIRRTEDGLFRVFEPGTGKEGTPFNTWEEAKTYYLDVRATFEDKTSHETLLKLPLDSTTSVSFVDFNGYDPKPSPTNESYGISAKVADSLFRDGFGAGSSSYEFTLNNLGTYAETVNKEGWELSIFDFVSEYLEKEDPELARKIGITNLHELSPRQASQLATEIVVRNTKYNYGYISEKYKSEPGTFPEPTPADKSSVMQILEEGLQNKDNPEWAGNGVCRNFAISVLCVFEALKKYQLELSQIKNTYCKYESGKEYAPGKKFEKGEAGHAWNSFLTIGKDGSGEATIVDATWAKQDLETKEVMGLDYTLTRMERMVKQIVEDPRRETDSETMQSVLHYYLTRIQLASSKNSAGYSTPQEQRSHFAQNALHIIISNGESEGIPDGLIQYLSKAIETLEPSSGKDVKTLQNLSVRYPELNIQLPDLLKRMYREKDFNSLPFSSLIFDDDALQIIAIDCLKSNPELFKDACENQRFQQRLAEVAGSLN